MGLYLTRNMISRKYHYTKVAGRAPVCCSTATRVSYLILLRILDAMVSIFPFIGHWGIKYYYLGGKENAISPPALLCWGFRVGF